jgi:hypothetical protein
MKRYLHSQQHILKFERGSSPEQLETANKSNLEDIEEEDESEPMVVDDGSDLDDGVGSIPPHLERKRAILLMTRSDVANNKADQKRKATSDDKAEKT